VFEVHRHNETVPTSKVDSGIPAFDNGATVGQIFFETDDMVTDNHTKKTDAKPIHTLENGIHKRGAMDNPVSDRAQVKINNKVLEILRCYKINNCQNEPHHKHQDLAKRPYQTYKQRTHQTLNRTCALPHCWLLAILCVCCYVLNHTALEPLNWQTPPQQLAGVMTNIPMVLRLIVCESFFDAIGDPPKYESSSSFPSSHGEAKGSFGFVNSVEDVCTYKMLTNDMPKVIFTSYVRTVPNEHDCNRRVGPEDSKNKPIKEMVKTPCPELGKIACITMLQFDPGDLIIRSFPTETNNHSQCFQATIA
jgi:hypothetical protein